MPDSSARRRAFRALDRPGLRSLLGLARSAELLVRERELCFVAPDGDGGWSLRARDAVLLGPEPNLPSPRRLRRRVLDVFCHAFQPGPGDTVLDIGAGVGREGVVFSQLVGATGAVHCIEAHPLTFDFLRRLRDLNDLDNMHCHHLAISDVRGEVTIGTERDAGLYYRNKLVSGSGGVTVPALTVADFMSARQVDAVDLLVMNIEGAERAALVGMAPVITRIRNVAIACHDFLANETGDETMKTKNDVREFLVANGFDISERADETRPWLRDFVYGVRGV